MGEKKKSANKKKSYRRSENFDIFCVTEFSTKRCQNTENRLSSQRAFDPAFKKLKLLIEFPNPNWSYETPNCSMKSKLVLRKDLGLGCEQKPRLIKKRLAQGPGLTCRKIRLPIDSWALFQKSPKQIQTRVRTLHITSWPLLIAMESKFNNS